MIDLLIECRDYRIPITSINPLFEDYLAGKERLILYTKQDLGSRKRDIDNQVNSTLVTMTHILIGRKGFR